MHMIKLMVVDDEKDSLLLYQLMFRSEIKNGEVELHCFDGAQKALDAMSSNLTDISVILSDINMPNMDGFEFLKHVRESNSSIPVFMVSAYGDEAHTNEAKKLGASDYFTKPVNFAMLKERINEVTSNRSTVKTA